MKRQPRRTIPIAEIGVDIEQAFTAAGPLDWRAVAVKQALKELAGTLHSLLGQRHVRDDVGHMVSYSPAEEQLLQLIPSLLPAAFVESHRQTLEEAIRRLLGQQPIGLQPLVLAAIADLQAIGAIGTAAVRMTPMDGTDE